MGSPGSSVFSRLQELVISGWNVADGYLPPTQSLTQLKQTDNSLARLSLDQKDNSFPELLKQLQQLLIQLLIQLLLQFHGIRKLTHLGKLLTFQVTPLRF